MATVNYYIDPLGLMGEPDFLTIFPSFNDAWLAIASELASFNDVDCYVLRGNMFNDNLSCGDGTAAGTLRIIFANRVPGWDSFLNLATPNNYSHAASPAPPTYTITIGFKNLIISGWGGFGAQVTFLADPSLTGPTEMNLTIDGFAQISGSFGIEAVGRVGNPVTVNATLRNCSQYDGPYLFVANATAAAATINLDMRHCEGGGEHAFRFTATGATAVINRTIKNHFCFGVPEDIEESGGTINNVACQNIFLETTDTLFDLTGTYGGTGHQLIEMQGTPLEQSQCVQFPYHGPEDLRRPSTSPLRNAGVDAGVATDFNGVPRSATPTIGAFELLYSFASPAGRVDLGRLSLSI